MVWKNFHVGELPCERGSIYENIHGRELIPCEITSMLENFHV